ncbi:MAG: amidohydrolase, partial [Mesorhizobium sp.]
MSVTGAGHSADLIVLNGRVLTMDNDNPAAEAVAVKDGAIIAIGSSTSIEEFKGPATKVIDALGGSVLPGFIEAHM